MAKESKSSKKFEPKAKKRRFLKKSQNLENIMTRFPNLFEDIFKEVDDKSLVNFRKLDKNWKKNTDSQRVYWIRMIKKCVQDCKDFRSEWIKAIKKTPYNFLKSLAKITFRTYQEFEEITPNYNYMCQVHVILE